MQHLSIDIETYSSVNLQKAGVYKYAESPDFDIILFGYSVDGGAVHVIDLACGEKIPTEIVDALSDESVTKWAFNAQFERVCLSNYLDTWLSPDSWHCTMVWSATLGLPLSLEGVGAVFGTGEAETDRGKKSHQILLCSLRPYQDQWRQNQKSSAARYGKVGAVQGI